MKKEMIIAAKPTQNSNILFNFGITGTLVWSSITNPNPPRVNRKLDARPSIMYWPLTLYGMKATWKGRNEPPHDKTKKMACAPSKDAAQPWQPLSLIRVFDVRMNKAWIFSYPLSAQRRLIRLGGCPGWSESSLGTHAILLVLSWGSSNNN